MRNQLIWLIIWPLVISCDNPFNVTPTDEDQLFQLHLSHSIKRIVTTGKVTLKWSEIIVEGFSKYIIERRKLGAVDWNTIKEEKLRITTKYVDTITDDEDLEYRVGISDSLGNIRWAEEMISIPRTRQLYVPAERSKIRDALYDPLIDVGDTIWVAPGEYYGNIIMLERNVVLISVAGAEKTVLLADSLNPRSVIMMNMGVVDGFTISEGVNRLAGGGIVLKGTGTVRRCRIVGNISSSNGGGVSMTDNSVLLNCVIYDNFALNGDNLFIYDAHGKVINNTITYVNKDGSSSNLYFMKDNPDLVMLNNIFYRPDSNSNLRLGDPTAMNGVYLDYSLVSPSLKGTNQNGIDNQIPMFAGYIDTSETFDFHLQLTSPGINAGSPDTEYNNVDGSRNTMGAYGGPYGD